mgnify:CR=1 FL=1
MKLNFNKNKKANYKQENITPEEENKKQQIQLLDGVNTSTRINKEKVSTVQFLTELVLNKMTEGELEEQQSKFQISSNIFMSENITKRILYLKELPIHVKPGFFEMIRELMLANLTSEQKKYTMIELVEHSLPNRIDFNNKKITRREAVFRSEHINIVKKAEKINKAIESGSPLNKDRAELEDLVEEEIRLNRKIESFSHIQRCQMNGMFTTNSFLFVEVASKDRTVCNRVYSELKSYLTNNKYKVEEVDPELYFKQFGLANLAFEEEPLLDIGPIMLPTEVTAGIEKYTQGIVRGNKGDIYVESEIGKGSSFIFKLKKEVK